MKYVAKIIRNLQVFAKPKIIVVSLYRQKEINGRAQTWEEQETKSGKRRTGVDRRKQQNNNKHKILRHYVGTEHYQEHRPDFAGEVR